MDRSSLGFIILLVVKASLVSGHHVPGHVHISVEEAFNDTEIVPDVLSVAPEQLLHVKYPKSEKIVDLGNEIAPVDVKGQPDVTYDADPKAYYSIILTDPDAPSRAKPMRREFRHWLVVNIPGSDVSKGRVLTAYVGSGPPKGSGLHRYTFLLFKQPKQLVFEEKVISKNEVGDRPLFSTQKFAEKYDLKLISGNFFQAQYDDSVPEIHKQLGITPSKQ